MSISICHYKYCRLTIEDYEDFIHSLKVGADMFQFFFKNQNLSMNYSIPSWEAVLTVQRSDEYAFTKALRKQGVEWSPESVQFKGEPESKMFGANWGSRHFSQFFIDTFGAPKDLFKTSVVKMIIRDLNESEMEEKEAGYWYNVDEFLATLILPIDFKEPFRVMPADFPDFSAWMYCEEEPYKLDDYNYCLNQSLRPLFHTTVLTAASVEQWISDRVEENQCEEEMMKIRAQLDYQEELEKSLKFESVEREKDEKGNEYYVNSSGMPVENSSLEKYDKTYEIFDDIRKARPDIKIDLFRLSLLKLMVEKSWDNGYAVGFY